MVRVFPMCIGRLLSIAEETVTEFISKATGTAIDWIQLPGMKVSVLTFNLHYQFLDVLDFQASSSVFKNTTGAKIEL